MRIFIKLEHELQIKDTDFDHNFHQSITAFSIDMYRICKILIILQLQSVVEEFFLRTRPLYKTAFAASYSVITFR